MDESNQKKNGNVKTPLEILIMNLKRTLDEVTQKMFMKDFLEIYSPLGVRLKERRTVVICSDKFCISKKTVCKHHLQFCIVDGNFKVNYFFCLEENKEEYSEKVVIEGTKKESKKHQKHQ